MTLRQTLFVALLTAVYLCFELAFNARLLDVVGGAASGDQLHSIEIFGRSLSGIALALFVLQGLLHLRNHGQLWRPGVGSIVFCCVVAAGAVFLSLKALTDHLVESSSASFRHASMNIVLIQRALVEGTVRIDGLADDNAIFSRPEGKAFLALFPVMAVSVDDLEEKIRSAKLDLIKNEISKELHGPAGYYKKYGEAVQAAANEWKRYNAASGSGKGVDVASRQNKAWDDYLRDLRKHGWTPYTIPDRYRSTVLQKVQAKIPVPSNWDLADEDVFRAAVAQRVEGRTQGAGAGIQHRGKQIPFGLSWPEFFGHPAVQGDLRDKLKLPRRAVLKVSYSSGDEFERMVFEPLLDDQARKKLEIYDSPTESYGDGKKNAIAGKDMARAAIVPPLALFFSLLGALGHICKLCYLSLRAVGQSFAPGRRWLGYLWAVPVAGFLIAALALGQLGNDVTRSRLYSYLEHQVISDDPEGMKPKALVKVLHIVAVGQGFFYPFDERLRTSVLGGMTFGYHPPEKTEHL